PVEREIGQLRRKAAVLSPLALVAAADVTVRAAEPDLLHLLPALSLVFPDRRLERRPVLVDGERLARLLHHAGELGVMELVLLLEHPQPADRNAEGADGVPHADEAHFDVAVSIGAEARAKLRRTRVGGLFRVAVELERLEIVRRVARAE